MRPVLGQIDPLMQTKLSVSACLSIPLGKKLSCTSTQDCRSLHADQALCHPSCLLGRNRSDPSCTQGIDSQSSRLPCDNCPESFDSYFCHSHSHRGSRRIATLSSFHNKYRMYPSYSFHPPQTQQCHTIGHYARRMPSGSVMVFLLWSNRDLNCSLCIV